MSATPRSHDRLHLIAIGANNCGSLSANRRAVAHAAKRLAQSFSVLRTSSAWRSPAWPPGSGPDFVNAVVAGHSALSPEAMLARLHAIEARAGRVRLRRWGPRVLDLDLLASGGLVRPDPATLRTWIDLPAKDQSRCAPDRPIVPHPRLADRAFVLLPLAEVAPGWRHPTTGRRAADMAAALPRAARQQMRRLPGPLAGPPRPR